MQLVATEIRAGNIIVYNGQLIHYLDRPANNFNRPKTLRLTTLSSIPAWT